MNILITNISLLSSTKEGVCSKEKIKYNDEIVGEIEALQTNEACCKYLMKKLNMNGEKIDNVICLYTDKVKNDEIEIEILKDILKNAKKTSLEYFKYSVQNFIKSQSPEFSEIDLGKSAENNNFDKPLKDIADEINKLANGKKKDEVNIYLDIAGGFRNISVLIQQLVKFLTYYGYKVEAYYTSLDTKNFFSCENAYRQMDILDAVNEFVTTGKSKQLSEYFDGYEDENVNELLSFMRKFSYSIQLCSVGDLDKILNNMSKSLDALEKSEIARAENVFLLKLMIPLIKSKFFSDESGKPKIDYTQIIQWCLDNGYIQQALTIYVEKIPEYFFTKNILSVDTDSEYYKEIEKESKNSPTKSNAYATLFYEKILANALTDSEREIEVARNEIGYAFSKYNIKTKNKNSKLKLLIKELHKICNSKYEFSDSVKQIQDKEIKDYLNTIIKNSKPKDKDDLIDRVKENKKLLSKYLNIQKESGDSCDIKKIRTDKLCIDNFPDEIKLNTSLQNIKDALNNYIEIKWIRNHINHASDEDYENSSIEINIPSQTVSEQYDKIFETIHESLEQIRNIEINKELALV
ncbi:MAG: TM1812 family CRISPR-associated protein [Ruminococcus sp.]|nr:TM1812 family CRISPR-associated protein [Ruminococcus sp.]